MMRAIYAALLLSFCQVALAEPAGGGSPETTLIVYISREQTDPARASLLQPVASDYGLKGARFGIQEINNSGRFLGHAYRLVEAVVPTDGDLSAMARRLFVGRRQLIVADLDGVDLLKLADLPEARDAVILNARASDDPLRQDNCRNNVFHLLPNWAMRTDALGQFLARKQWKRWLVLRGVTPADQGFTAAIKRTAARVGAIIVAEKTYQYRGDDDPEHSREQVQAQIPEATQAPGAYDVLFVADSSNAFGDYVLFNSRDSRLVVGTHGLTAVAWDSQFGEYAARGVLYRFYKLAGREMNERDYGSWLATAIFGEAITRGGATSAADIRSYLLSDRFSIGANKGEGLTFRRWDHQLRQPLLLFGPKMLVAMAPQADATHLKLQTDTLGFDQTESKCRRVQLR